MAKWKTEYEYFNNNLSFKYEREVLDFFKTQPSNKQILILDKRENKINLAITIAFLYGLVIGFTIFYFLFFCYCNLIGVL